MVTNNYICFRAGRWKDPSPNHLPFPFLLLTFISSDPEEEAILVVSFDGLVKAKKELRRLSGCELEEHVISLDVPPFQVGPPSSSFFLSTSRLTRPFLLPSLLF
jgi:hypothetical protein